MLHHRTGFQPLIICALVFFCAASPELTSAQAVPDSLAVSAGPKASNPPVPRYVARQVTRSAKESIDERNKAGFKQYIEDGNTARNRSDYQKALSSYLKASELVPNDASAHYGVGNVYFDVACYDSAIDFYGRAVKVKPDYLDALVQLGYAYVRKERYDEAQSVFESAVAAKPKHIAARLGRAHVWAKTGKYQEAIDSINQIVSDRSASDKDRALAYTALGNVFVAEQKWQESIAPFEKATKVDPELAVAFVWLGVSQMVSAFSQQPSSSMDITLQDREIKANLARRATETLRIAIDVKKYEHPSGLLVLGMALGYQSNYQGALSKINLYLERVRQIEAELSGLDSKLVQKCDYAFGRSYADGYIQLGHVYAREAGEAGNDKNALLNQAIEQFKKAITAKQDYAGSYSSLGNIYLAQGKHQKAIEEYERALIYETSDSAKASMYAVLGAAYSHIGPRAKALDYLNKAISLAPKESTAYGVLAALHYQHGDHDESIRLAAKVIELDRQPRASSYWSLALAYFLRAQKNGKDADYEQAITLLNEAIKINKTFAQAYLALGNVYKFYKGGANRESALVNYEKAKELDPQNASIYFMIGDLHASVTGNQDAAIKYLSEAIRLKPDYAMAYLTLGMVYAERKDDAEAIRLFLEVLKYEKDTKAYFMLGDAYDRQKNYSEAIKWMQEYARGDPESHLPYLHLARIYTHWLKKDEAIRYYQEAIKRLKSDDIANKSLYLCRVVRLRGQYDEALACFQKLVYPLQDQVPYEIGVTYIASGNKQAALAQHQQLVQLKSSLARYLMEQINEMKQE